MRIEVGKRYVTRGGLPASVTDEYLGCLLMGEIGEGDTKTKLAWCLDGRWWLDNESAFDLVAEVPGEVTPSKGAPCRHTWIDVGFSQIKFVCKHCGITNAAIFERGDAYEQERA